MATGGWFGRSVALGVLIFSFVVPVEAAHAAARPTPPGPPVPAVDDAVPPALGRGATANAGTASNNAIGSRRAAVVLFNFASAPELPRGATAAQANDLVFTGTDSVRAFWLAQSRGLLQLTGQVYEETLPVSFAPTCDQRSQWRDYFDPKYGPGNDFVLLVAPNVGCVIDGNSYGGHGEMPGKYSWFYNGIGPNILYHELGHNLGFAHAHGLKCTNASKVVPMSDTCTTDDLEYGDISDPMGSGRCSYSAWNRRNAGWPVEEREMTNRFGTYSLRASDLSADGSAQSFNIDRPDDAFGTHYEVEWVSRAFGSCTSSELPEPGLLIRAVGPNGAGQPSALLTTQPFAGTSQPWLAVGETFSDPKTRVAIRLDALSSTTATVTLLPAGTAEVVGGTLRYTEQAGLASTMAVSDTVDGVLLWDPGATMTMGAGCQKLGAYARCSGSITGISIDAGDLDDAISVTSRLPTTIRGSSGEDVFNAGATRDGPTTFYGGDGRDTAEYSNRTGAVKVKLDDNANDGEATEHDNMISVDAVNGGGGSDHLIGNSSNNTLRGNGGNDVLEGRGGADSYFAGDGDDKIKARDNAIDLAISCGAGNDKVRRDASFDLLVIDCERVA